MIGDPESLLSTSNKAQANQPDQHHCPTWGQGGLEDQTWLGCSGRRRMQEPSVSHAVGVWAAWKALSAPLAAPGGYVLVSAREPSRDAVVITLIASSFRARSARSGGR
jgi:hypothetical protein